MKNLFYVFPILVFSGVVCASPFNVRPVWMQDQIKEDLKPFYGRVIKKSELLEELQLPRSKNNHLILVEIKNNALLLSEPSDTSGHPDIFPHRLNVLRTYFEHLAAERRLPNVSFLLSVHDSFNYGCQTGDFPIFTFAKRKSDCAVLLPDFEAWVFNDDMLAQYENYCLQHPWEAKREIMFWRGSSTGTHFTLENYKSLSRIKLVMLGEKASSWLDVGLVTLCQGAEKIPELRSYVKPFENIKNHFAYKYLIDVDGNSCTYSRCRWILLSNSVLVKPESQNVQWYYKALKPYEHYIPVRGDWSDLEEKYRWLKANDKEAQHVAFASQQLGKSLFSATAIGDYIEQLLREYATLYSEE